MEGKRMGVVQDLLFLYIVFNCVMGSFACFWSLSLIISLNGLSV